MLILIPVIGFFGYSNSGKTTVVAKLITMLTDHGYRVAAIKHAPHGYDLDVVGKDSWQHFQAGAQTVVLAGPDTLTIHERLSSEPGLKDAINRIKDNPEVDLILVEGFKHEPGPKIQIIRGNDDTPERSGQDLIAAVSDVPIEADIPYFDAENLEPLAKFIIDTYLGHK